MEEDVQIDHQLSHHFPISLKFCEHIQKLIRSQVNFRNTSTKC